jgi:predicted lipid carrier protein YhbT
MRQMILLGFVLTLVLSSCQKNDIAQTGAESLNGQWKMVKVKDLASGTEISKPASVTGDVVITFSH